MILDDLMIFLTIFLIDPKLNERLIINEKTSYSNNLTC